MKLIFHFMYRYLPSIVRSILLKFVGAVTELAIPYILAHLIDEVVPLRRIELVLLWGGLMILTALASRWFNIWANRSAVYNAHLVSYDVRQALFAKTMNLSGTQFDAFGLPSLISRMTSDSYNVQNCVRALQMMCTRIPILLCGGILAMMLMDPVLAGVLCVLVPILLSVVLLISRFGIPLYRRVQERLDDVVRIMREDITGIRVVKALSKTDYEKARFRKANDEMTRTDIRASTIMAIPSPFMQMCLNVGLTLVVWIGARRVYTGAIKPGVILAFLTYFNMVMQGAMGINRIFMMLSQSTASANRIAQVLAVQDDQPVLHDCPAPHGDAFIRFEHVSFRYADEGAPGGDVAENCLTDIDFSIRRGESLGIIGPTGCGKTTIVNLLMRFYDPQQGAVFVDGRDVRSYPKDELRRKFGVVFQNDTVFFNTLRENIRFGRPLDDRALARAAQDAVASEYIDSLEEGLDYQADIRGANLSGGQKQRLLISRALAGDPEILILDDSSSALDYKTDAMLRQAIFAHHKASTTIMIAQRVSSIQHMTHILVLDGGRCVGYGSHEELLRSCPAYGEIYRAQMGALD